MRGVSILIPVLKKEFRVLSARIHDLQWSPNGLRIIACGEGKGRSFVRAFMWDFGTNVGEFDGHSRRVLSCAYKPTRPFRVVTCGEDFLVNFYEGPPFRFKLSHKDHSNFVNCVRYSPDGSKFITVLTVSADKSAKVWDITENNNGKVKKTLTCPSSGGIEDMLVGCLWLNDYLVTISLSGTMSIFLASDLDKAPTTFSRHMKNVSSLTILRSNPHVLLSSSYDGLIGRVVELKARQWSEVHCSFRYCSLCDLGLAGVEFGGNGGCSSGAGGLTERHTAERTEVENAKAIFTNDQEALKKKEADFKGKLSKLRKEK
ncbi:hypothetical protein VNO78_21707 [Psophocarpus tetragonolobus]|uniref:Uncharacterized protein n=1 Tax=Psophocarpus tetragonolobus TaxID=3891 RepID=A0AAN9SBE1_PSOTE